MDESKWCKIRTILGKKFCEKLQKSIRLGRTFLHMVNLNQLKDKGIVFERYFQAWKLFNYYFMNYLMIKTLITIISNK